MHYPLVKPSYYFSLFKDIISFIKTPHNKLDLEKPTKQKIYDTIGLFVLKMIFLIPVILFIAVIHDPKNIQNANMAERFPPLILLFVAGFILPLLEEIAFRLSLVFNAVYLSLSSSALMYYLLTKAIFQTKISSIDDSFLTRATIAVCFGIIIFFILNIKSIKENVGEFWVKNFRSIYYISCIVFAWMHIYKYELIWMNFLFLPIITLPQLFSGIIYGYTRVSFGFKYPLILHMSMNTISIGVSLLSSGVD